MEGFNGPRPRVAAVTSYNRVVFEDIHTLTGARGPLQPHEIALGLVVPPAISLTFLVLLGVTAAVPGILLVVLMFWAVTLFSFVFVGTRVISDSDDSAIRRFVTALEFWAYNALIVAGSFYAALSVMYWNAGC